MQLGAFGQSIQKALRISHSIPCSLTSSLALPLASHVSFVWFLLHFSLVYTLQHYTFTHPHTNTTDLPIDHFTH